MVVIESISKFDSWLSKVHTISIGSRTSVSSARAEIIKAAVGPSGLDQKAFTECLTTEEAARFTLAVGELSKGIGGYSAPKVFVDNKPLLGGDRQKTLDLTVALLKDAK